MSNPFSKGARENRIVARKKQEIIKVGAEFAKLIKHDKAWAYYIVRIRRMLDTFKQLHDNSRITGAKPEDLERLKRYEWQIDILEWALVLPESYVKQIVLKEGKKEEEAFQADLAKLSKKENANGNV